MDLSLHDVPVSLSIRPNSVSRMLQNVSPRSINVYRANYAIYAISEITASVRHRKESARRRVNTSKQTTRLRERDLNFEEHSANS